MNNIVFKKENGCCPYFVHNGIKYYLDEDKPFGKYEWCLMCHSLTVQSKTFKSELELSNWLRNDDLTQEQFDELKDKYGENWWYRYYIKNNFDWSDSAWLVAKDKDWRFDKKELKLTELPKREQLSAWGTYEETLSFAREYLTRIMEEEKLTLF